MPFAREYLLNQEAKFFDDMVVGSNSLMRNVLHTMSRLSGSEIPVLIQGESGTGKKLVARAIHKNSPRSHKSWLSLDCGNFKKDRLESELFGFLKDSFEGALRDTKGLFAEADEGTLLIENIGDMPLELQGKLLLALEQGEFRRIGSSRPEKADVRIICTTTESIESLRKKGRIRPELAFRVASLTIYLPPLRERKEDLPLLAKFIIERKSMHLGKEVTKVTNKAMGNLLAYHYPGNIRELEHILMKALIATEGSTILEEHLPPYVQNHEEIPEWENTDVFINEIDLGVGFKELRKTFEKHLILQYLKKTEGNVTHAAKLAGIGRESFHRIMNRLDIPRIFSDKYSHEKRKR